MVTPTADPLVIETLKNWRTLLEAADDQILEDMGREWLKIERGLQIDMRLLADETARRVAAGEVVTDQMVWKSERFPRVQRLMMDQIEAYNQRFAVDYITQAQAEFANLGIRSAREAITASYLQAGQLRAFDMLNLDAVRAMVGVAGDGSPLRTLLLRDYSEELSQQVIDSLVNGIARGQGVARTAEDMADAMGMGLDRSLLIARTETARAYRNASVEQYRASGVVKGFKRLVKKETACLACLFLDGETFESADEMDDHPNGKCMAVPIVEGVGAAEWTTGQDWFETLSDDRQADLLGEARYTLWKEGGVSLPDLVTKKEDPTWGPSPMTIPLRDLP